MLVAIIGLSWDIKNLCWSKVKLSMKQISYLIIINYDEIILIIAHLPSRLLLVDCNRRNLAHSIKQSSLWSFKLSSLIEIFWSDLTLKQLSSRIYRSAGTPVLLLSRPEYSEVALECLQSGKSRNFVAYMSNLTKKILSVIGRHRCSYLQVE